MAISQAVANAILGQRAPDILGSFEQGQAVARGREERSRARQIQELSGQSYKGDAEAFGELQGIAPEVALELQNKLNIKDKGGLDRLYTDAKTALSIYENYGVEGVISFGENRIQGLKSMFADTQDTERVLNFFKTGNIEEGVANLKATISAFDQAKSMGPTGAMRERNSLLNDLNSDDPNVRRSAEVALKLTAAPVGSADITTATTEGLSEQVGDSQATIKERAKFGELTGTSRANTIDKGYESIQLIDKGLSNIDRAIQAVRDGASTGKIASKFPSIARAAVELEQIADSMALDVIGSVTLGAISEAELDLARQVALPVGLKGEDLIQHLMARKSAQIKLRGYLEEQVDFLDQGGTIPQFLRRKKAQREQAATQQGDPQTPPTQQSQPQRMRFDAKGNIL